MEVTLNDLKEKYIKELQSELGNIENAPTIPGLLGITNLQKNMMIIDKDVKQIAEKINKCFVEELNSENIEEAFSDETRLKCYETFREECAKIISDFSKGFLAAKNK